MDAQRADVFAAFPLRRWLRGLTGSAALAVLLAAGCAPVRYEGAYVPGSAPVMDACGMGECYHRPCAEMS